MIFEVGNSYISENGFRVCIGAISEIGHIDGCGFGSGPGYWYGSGDSSGFGCGQGCFFGYGFGIK